MYDFYLGYAPTVKVDDIEVKGEGEIEIEIEFDQNDLPKTKEEYIDYIIENLACDSFDKLIGNMADNFEFY